MNGSFTHVLNNSIQYEYPTMLGNLCTEITEISKIPSNSGHTVICSDTEKSDRSIANLELHHGYSYTTAETIAHSRLDLENQISESHSSLAKNINDEMLICRNCCCSFFTRSTSQFETHMALQCRRCQSRERKYRCFLCTYQSSIEENLQSHLREHANEDATSTDKRVICDVCKVALSSEIGLMIHMKTHYDGEYYCCDICIVRTRRLSQLINHRRYHTEENPNRCPYCNYKSTKTDNLQRHVKFMHEIQDSFYDTFNPREMLTIPKFNEIAAHSESPFLTPSTSFSNPETSNYPTLLQ